MSAGKGEDAVPRRSWSCGGAIAQGAGRLLLVVLSLAVAAAICEAGVRWLAPSFNRYLILPPHMRTTFHPRAGAMPGVEGPSRFITNAFGIRGEEFTDDQTYRVLALGGSSTECLYLDQSEAWPAVLEGRLNALDRGTVWVGNAGSTGKHTRDHLLHVKYFVPQLPRIDAVILLVGVNDLMLRLRDLEYQPMALTPSAEAAQMEHAFYFSPYGAADPSYRQSAVWRLLRQVRYVYVRRHAVLDKAGAFYITRRVKRQQAKRPIAAAPDLTTALAEYRRNLDRIIDLGRAQGVRMILVTQPVLWRAGLTRDEERLLWGLELPGTGAYYTVEVLAEAMQRYNDVLRDVCRTRGVECVDLARQLPRDAGVFFDDMHVTEGGAVRVADIAAAYLSARPPFGPQTADVW